MDAATFAASCTALEPFFRRLAQAGNDALGMDALRRIGIEAEAAMRDATGGVNTHRGAIFGLGLLAAAAGALGAGTVPIAAGALGAHVADRHARGILAGPVLLHAPGAQARRRHGVGGAPAEAAAGFPTVYRVGLPALLRGTRLRLDEPEAARVEACLSLIAVTEDTNLLHRGGVDGLEFARQSAAAFIAAGGVGQPGWRDHAKKLHRDFVARRLSPGGAADLLAMTLFVDALEG
ncbi:putative 2-(5''-triphosphoribosyl)-3'-dephosphocoenzyme-A synthase [Methylobacterium haplocladii]|uniref:Probable 2-(5''-triphosphoribosyl)-3'-dephosphocoenzyme-A synthase n=4 Tax=Methylobacterium haplocladii TaxID=1176176 RepID=A0A512IPD8_9HYPH|nr:putative 2-(5''-triphosphoribosyl)-3'-dephosphocoenzyme-A synthase [Methylobacterium haplocladii]